MSKTGGLDAPISTVRGIVNPKNGKRHIYGRINKQMGVEESLCTSLRLEEPIIVEEMSADMVDCKSCARIMSNDGHLTPLESLVKKEYEQTGEFNPYYKSRTDSVVELDEMLEEQIEELDNKIEAVLDDNPERSPGWIPHEAKEMVVRRDTMKSVRLMIHGISEWVEMKEEREE